MALPFRSHFLSLGLVALQAALVVALGGAVAGNVTEQSSLARDQLAIAQAHARIVYLDEVLTMSAYMAAQTGDPSWAERYRAHEPLLRTTIDDTLARSQPGEGEHVRSLREANERLVAIETRVLELAGAGRLSEARAEIGGLEYQRWKAQYSRGVESLLDAITAREHDRGRIRGQQSVLAVTSVAIAAVLPSLGMILLSLRAATATRRAAGAESASRTSRAREELVLDALDVGAIEADSDHISLSPSARRLLGVELVEPTWGDLRRELGGPATSKIEQALVALRTVGAGGEVTDEVDVRERWLRLRARRLADGNDVAVVHDVTDTKARERELEARVAERTEALAAQTQRVRTLLAELASTEERERHRVAAIVHDDLQQALVAIRLQIGGLHGRAGDMDLAPLERAVEHALSALRSLVAELVPPLVEQSLSETLLRIADEAEQQLGLLVDLEIEEGLDVGPVARAMLGRALRELVLNVHKHARATSAVVTVALDGARIALTVTDDGAGFPAEVTYGFGLSTLARRAEALGGALTIAEGPHGRVRFEVDRRRLPEGA